MKLKRLGTPAELDVAVLSQTAGSARVSVNGMEFDVSIEKAADGAMLLTIGSRRIVVRAARSRNALAVAIGPSSFTFAEVETRSSARRGATATPEMTAPMPGKVLKILVTEGDTVAAGDPLIVLEAMKRETTLFAEGAAVIRKIGVSAGQMVDHGAVLLELTPAANSSASESPAPGT
jgi:acetyl/propionyl-CoA carboxylase alpha subunit